MYLYKFIIFIYNINIIYLLIYIYYNIFILYIYILINLYPLKFAEVYFVAYFVIYPEEHSMYT